jgi:hypothetical protein
MSNYKMQIIHSNIEVLENYIDLVDTKVMDSYKTDIMRLPQSEQKSEWYKYTLINNLITQSIETVSLLTEQINTMHTKQDFDFQKRQINALRNYVKILGGNPSIISYTKDSDICENYL